MKIHSHPLAAALGLAALATLLPAAESKSTGKTEPRERREIRVVTGPDREHHVLVHPGARREKPETEVVTFLGVEASDVPAVLGAQLGLPRGTGLVIGHVAPKSAAAGVLQEHDILLKLDDQILVDPHQLSVLVRNHREGDEVVLTYIRGGKQATASVKLGQHEVPKLSWTEAPGREGFPPLPGGGRMEFLPGGAGSDRERAEVDRLLSLMHRPPGGGPTRIQIERREGPGIRAMSINTGNSNLVFKDEAGSLELTVKDGAKTLVAKDPAGAELFSGPVTTPEERQALPAEVCERLERLEGMQEMTFKTDGNFKGAETRIMRPLGRGISVPPARMAPKRLPAVL